MAGFTCVLGIFGTYKYETIEFMLIVIVFRCDSLIYNGMRDKN